MGKVDPPAFAKAVAAARRHLDESQADFGQRFSVGRQTIARWEIGAAFPAEYSHGLILRAASDLPAPIQEPIRVALGGDPVAASAASVLSPTASRSAPADVHAVMEAIVFRVAEELDLGPRGVRAALANALGEMDQRGVSVQAGRDALRARVAAAGVP